VNANDWNAIADFLEQAQVGDFVEYNDRTVEVVNMVGGKFLHYDENGEIAGLVNAVWKSCDFLKFGKIYTN